MKLASWLLGMLAACGSPPDEPGPDAGAPLAPLEEGELAPGGATTVDNATMGAFTVRAANVGIDRSTQFQLGQQFFQLPWVPAPGRPEADGLGPTFNADRCTTCHGANGRGTIPSILLRLGHGPASEPLAAYGVQLQDFSIGDASAEGTPVRREMPVDHVLEGGESVRLTSAAYEVQARAFGDFEPDTQLSPRIAPIIVGQGLIEALTDEDLLALHDPDDTDGDGISGRAHLVQGRVGRFGWKATHVTVESQAAAAFAQDLGITSTIFPEANCPPAQASCAAATSGGEPELIPTRLDATIAYIHLLGVPARRAGDSDPVRRGKALFSAAGCASCHRPWFVTSSFAPEPELSSQKVWPYSDFLLHDVGDALADGYKEGDATGREWRTPPLWGLGLVPVVNGELHLLHDGRAASVEEAILWHDGEARASRLSFERLSIEERALLIAFVESL